VVWVPKVWETLVNGPIFHEQMNCLHHENML